MIGNLLDENLDHWDKLGWDKQGHDLKPSLLIGNGFSQNIWPGFKYNSLFEKASENSGVHLTAADVSLFDCLNTHNFEVVLSALATSKTVSVALNQHNNSLNQYSKLFETHERSIRDALIKAVHDVHVRWAEDLGPHLLEIADELEKYKSIYCTNYDLIIYWSIMKYIEDRYPYRFVDYFWPSPFNILNTKVNEGRLAVHFLHGGLHLCKNRIGQTFKRENVGIGESLLDSFGIDDPDDPDKIPLFISEGTAEDKLRSINQSNYLSFVLSRFGRDSSRLVILGHSLGDSDKHIANAINAHQERQVAISVRKHGNIRKKKAAIRHALPDVELSFFDAATHPLLRESLRIEETPP